MVSVGSGSAISSITDSQGNTFTQVGSDLTSPGGNKNRVYYANNILGGADTVTITLSTSNFMEVFLSEYSGVDTVNPVDVTVGNTGVAGSVTSGIATTTTPGDKIYGFCFGDWSCLVGSGFTVRSNLNNNLVEDMTATTIGSYAATASANNGWSMRMVALRPR
jgi:hypothetical protein